MPKTSGRAGADAGRRIGVRDVARACGLSPMTVSRALRDAPNVHPDTRERICAVARELGYVPNRLAASLSRQRSGLVGAVIPDLEHTIFPAVVKAVENALSAEGYNLLLCCSYDHVGKERRCVQSLLENRVDGVIIAPASTAESREGLKRLRAMDCPLVLIDRLARGVDADAVLFDDFEGAARAVAHLLERGYRHIAHISGPQSVWTCAERLRGYRHAHVTAGHAVPDDGVVRVPELSIAQGELAMERILDRPRLPDAVFCVNDPVAIGAFKALRRRGVRIPDAMGLVGFSNTLESEITEAPLTTVDQDAARLGQQAAQLLLERLKAPDALRRRSVRRVVATSLVVRRSSQKPRRTPSA